MKEQYMKRVKKLLRVPRRKKRDILRDLEESFASAAEHGETEQQLLDRLGTPEEFTAAMGSPEDEADWRRQRTLAWLGISLAAFVLVLGLRAVVVLSWERSLGIIGGADGPTVIITSGDGPINTWELIFCLLMGQLWSPLTYGPAWAGVLSLVAAAALISAVIQALRLLFQRRKRP